MTDDDDDDSSAEDAIRHDLITSVRRVCVPSLFLGLSLYSPVYW